jgi:Tfp pilus assembly protein PilV
MSWNRAPDPTNSPSINKRWQQKERGSCAAQHNAQQQHQQMHPAPASADPTAASKQQQENKPRKIIPGHKSLCQTNSGKQTETKSPGKFRAQLMRNEGTQDTALAPGNL